MDFWLPSKEPFRLRRVSAEVVDLRRAEVLLLTDDVLLPVLHVRHAEGFLHKLPHGVSLSRGADKLRGLLVPEDAPHQVDILGSVAPVPLRIEVAQGELLRLAESDLRDAVADLPGDELKPAPIALVVEEDA